MIKKIHNFNLKQVEEVLILKSWWAAIFVLPVSKRIILFLSNYTEIQPNSITSFSVTVRLFSVFFFLRGDHLSLIIGAIMFQLAYIADCMDGPIARLKGTESLSGRYFDHISDMLGDILVLLALACGQGIMLTPIIIAMACLHFCEYYITYVVNMVLEKNHEISAKIKGLDSNFAVKSILKYRDMFFQKNFKSFLSLPDYEALTFFVFPVIGRPLLGINAGFYFLVLVVLYKVFSSFITIHTGGKKFP